MTAHKWHKELMAVAEASKTSSEPCVVLQIMWSPNGAWQTVSKHTIHHLFNVDRDDISFRIKPSTIMINGIEVNKPLRVRPEMGQRYWIAKPDLCGDPYCGWWEDNKYDNVCFNNGRIHLKEEDARAHIEADYAGSREKK